MVLGVGADLDVERYPAEEASIELEDDAVAAGAKRSRELAHTSIRVGRRVSDRDTVTFERDMDSRRRAPARRVQDVR